MQTRGLAVTIVALAASCLAYAAQNRSRSPAPIPAITTTREVHNLPLAQAVHGYPVYLHAVVTYYDPYAYVKHGALFVCDRSGCLFVYVPVPPVLPLHAGDTVVVRGVTGSGKFAPIVEASHVRIVGHSSLPANPRRVSLTQMLTGALDCQWVEFEGRVRFAHLEPDNVVLDIATGGGSLEAISLRDRHADYDALVDSLVRIRANVAAVFNNRRQMVGARLYFPSLAQIRVIQQAAADPFAQPADPISDLFRFRPDPELIRRVHVQGRVTLDWPGHTLCIQELTNGVCMHTSQSIAAPVGSFVDVAGFPVVNMFKPSLEDVVFRPTEGAAALPQPDVVTAAQAILGDLDGRLVQMDAEFIGRDPASDVPTLLLRSNGLLFPAVLPPNSGLAEKLPWKEGSFLRITGVSSVQVDSLTTELGDGAVRPESLRILLRSPSDVAVLRAPSWWNSKHALECFAAIGLLVLIAFTWIVVLRHSVKLRTRELRLSEERLRHLSEHDALTGLPNRLHLNDRLQSALERAAQNGKRLGLLMVDLDGFKAVNDELGHRAGDKLLRMVAERLRVCVRLTDAVARVGGDEFIVLLPDLRHPAEAASIARKIVSAIAAPFAIDHAIASVTASVGAVISSPGGSNLEAMLQCADQAMYAAKEKGKNCVHAFIPTRGPFLAASTRRPRK